MNIWGQSKIGLIHKIKILWRRKGAGLNLFMRRPGRLGGGVSTLINLRLVGMFGVVYYVHRILLGVANR